MGKKKEEEPYEQEPEIEEEDDYSYESSSAGTESDIEKPTIQNFYNTEALLLSIEKTLRGYQKRNGVWVYVTEPVARDEFINKTINSLRSIINPQNMMSKKTEEEIHGILWEANMMFIDACEDEPTISGDDIEFIVNMFDHALELFMGHVQNGHASGVLKEIYAGVAHEDKTMQNDDSIINWSFGDKTLLKVGGGKR